jgi:hypothetical protein
VVGRDADVRGVALEHLRHRVENACNGPEGRIQPAPAPDSVELAEQLVRAVDQVDDHRGRVSAP